MHRKKKQVASRNKQKQAQHRATKKSLQTKRQMGEKNIETNAELLAHESPAAEGLLQQWQLVGGWGWWCSQLVGFVYVFLLFYFHFRFR